MGIWHDLDLGRPIAVPLERCAELLGVDLASIREPAGNVEPCVRAEAPEFGASGSLERQLRPEAYGRRRGGGLDRLRARPRMYSHSEWSTLTGRGESPPNSQNDRPLACSAAGSEKWVCMSSHLPPRCSTERPRSSTAGRAQISSSPLGYGGAKGGAVELEISAETARKRSTDDLQKYHANGHDVTDPATVDHP